MKDPLPSIADCKVVFADRGALRPFVYSQIYYTYPGMAWNIFRSRPFFFLCVYLGLAYSKSICWNAGFPNQPTLAEKYPLFALLMQYQSYLHLSLRVC